jgi:undecaprenyl-diphosphatase
MFGPDLWLLCKQVLKGIARPRELARSEDGRLAIALVSATVPTALIGLFFEDAVEAWAHSPVIVGLCLLASAGAALLTRLGRGGSSAPGPVAAAVIGVFQGLAVLPGLSRSGSTIACGMLLGLSPQAAFRFSFLLSVPAVAGAILLKLRDVADVEGILAPLVVGVLVALVTGYGALRLLAKMVSRGQFWWFALYLIPLGTGLIIWDLARGS